MTDVTRPSVRNLSLFCDFELRTLSQGDGASIILFGCYVLDRIRAEFCPAEGPAGNLTDKSIEMFINSFQ